ncbi:glutamyl-tRNA reductase [Paenibacillus thermotolerans]|uniref:glutamyl-tRNA reductase n=1 Tax=Paenibacillus thermotolerans TaxID=3027807 RepID=UPI0023684D82|nr:MULTISPECIES: glutamyl-tRNA reductase [unclassified Paenibacillus]
MHIVVVGLNYKTAPVEVRERFAFAPEKLPQALRELKGTKSILECVIVGTCNRTEIYAVVDRSKWCGQYIRAFIEAWFGVPRGEYSPYLYVHEDDAALRHLFNVTCGLDSMVLGETQILGQVRDAFLLSQSERATGTIFNSLFKQAVTVAKRAHSETAIGENAVSVSYAAVELGKRIFGSFAKKKVLILGAGKMSELTAKHLHAGGAVSVSVVNRTLSRAEELASKFGGSAHSLERLPELLADSDVVISSTGSDGLVLTKSDVEAAMRARPSRPLFMIDIAVPRDLDPAIHDVQNVYLYDIDDLEGIVEANMELRRQEAAKIESLIDEGIADFHQWYRTLGVGPVIRALQDKASAIHEETLADMRKKLPDLTDREWKVISKLTKSMLNQLTHDPILRVKELAPGRRGDEAIERFVELFALEESIVKQRHKERETEQSRAGAEEKAASAAGGRGSYSLA